MWQLELRNNYLSRDIKSVSELYGQRMYLLWYVLFQLNYTDTHFFSLFCCEKLSLEACPRILDAHCVA
jgi:hypothetical protein